MEKSEDFIIRKDEIKRQFGIKSDATYYDWINKGVIPKPFKIAGDTGRTGAAGLFQSQVTARKEKLKALNDGGANA